MAKTYKYIIGAVAGLVVLGIFSLSSGLVNPSWNPFKQPPSGEVLEDAIANLGKVEKMRILANVNLAMESPKKITGALTLNQSIDSSDKSQKKNLTDFNLSVGVEGMELSLSAQMIGVDKNLYLKINSLPEYLPLGIDVETLKNQWLLIDPAQLGLLGITASSSDTIKEPQDAEFFNELKALIAGKNVFKLKRSLGKETIDNQTSSHYSAEVNKQTAKELLPQIFAIIDKQLPGSGADGYQQDLQDSLSELEQNFDEIWKVLGGLNFEVWIDDSTQTLRKIKFAKEIQQTKLGIEVSFLEFGKDIAIEKPVDAKPIEQVLPPDLLGLPSATPSPATSSVQ